MSQRELGERAGTSAAAICLYEQGARVPRVDTLERIIEATGASLELSVNCPAIDVAASGRDLEMILELADHLPAQFADDLPYPLLRDLAA